MKGSNYSIFKYQGVIRKAIISLKYKFSYDVADEIVERMVSVLSDQKIFLTKRYTLVSIPLFWQRQNWRGFNQSELIGEKLAKQLGWKFAPDLLIRNKNTTPQVGLKGSTRRNNLSGVFEVGSNYTLYPEPCTLVLFDDVFTTGSTINEAKKVLKVAGFKNIKSLTIAR
jgi:ComF family protein